MTQADTVQAVLHHADAHMDESLARLFDLVRIPSVSTVPAHAGDCRAAARWLADQQAGLGFDASVRPTGGHPMVVAHQTDATGPHVLFYGHYDVQPVDPLDLWDSNPFEPVLRPAPDGDTHIVGRGASDDKGQLLTFIEACRAWKAVTGSLPIKVSMLFEGEEESGSASLGPFLRDTADELRADVVMVCDTDMWDRDTPAITTMLRGLVGEEFTITTADRDLHSGMFGNARAQRAAGRRRCAVEFAQPRRRRDVARLLRRGRRPCPRDPGAMAAAALTTREAFLAECRPVDPRGRGPVFHHGTGLGPAPAWRSTA